MGVKAFQFNGTPSDCVKVATELMESAPDIVLSGINRGSNLGTDVMYSGTVSGAIEAAIYDIPAIALSLDNYEAYKPQRLRDGGRGRMGAGPALWAKASGRRHGAQRQRARVPNRGAGGPPGSGCAATATCCTVAWIRGASAYYWMAGEIEDADWDDESVDTVAVRRGYISVTPISFDLTKYEALETSKVGHAIPWPEPRAGRSAESMKGKVNDSPISCKSSPGTLALHGDVHRLVTFLNRSLKDDGYIFGLASGRRACLFDHLPRSIGAPFDQDRRRYIFGLRRHGRRGLLPIRIVTRREGLCRIAPSPLGMQY